MRIPTSHFDLYTSTQYHHISLKIYHIHLPNLTASPIFLPCLRFLSDQSNTSLTKQDLVIRYPSKLSRQLLTPQIHLLLDPKMSSSREEGRQLDRWHQHALDAERAADAKLRELRTELRVSQDALSEINRLLGIASDGYEREVMEQMRREEVAHYNDLVQWRIPEAQARADARRREADATYQALEEWGYTYDNYEHVSRRRNRR